MKAISLFRRILLLLLFPFLVIGSDLVISGEKDLIREITRPAEFDYVTWTIDSLALKVGHLSTNFVQFLEKNQQIQMVMDYLVSVENYNALSAKIGNIYANPTISNPTQAAASLLVEQKSLKSQLSQQSPVIESILQLQVSNALDQIGISAAGQPLPPLLFHITSIPKALIVSPRNIIEEKYDISLLPDIPLDQIVAIEQFVEERTRLSALVVSVGGIGVYPTMVMSSTNLPWLLEVISHEWTHNYLTVKPLGVNYSTNNDLRTMNETTANIAGKEISTVVLQMFYPALAPPETSSEGKNTSTPGQSLEEFNFNAEMHATRVEVDRFLAAGLIDEAEQYMEQRRQFFWEHGYQIRRLNQAYFAFYGAYADVPLGEAGMDPVGPAVIKLRNQSASLKAFLKQISKMTDFSQLQQAVQTSP
jgi:hypothetical protein